MTVLSFLLLCIFSNFLPQSLVLSFGGESSDHSWFSELFEVRLLSLSLPQGGNFTNSVCESPGNVVKMQVQGQQGWGDAWGSASLTSSQLMLIVLVCGPHCEKPGFGLMPGKLSPNIPRKQKQEETMCQWAHGRLILKPTQLLSWMVHSSLRNLLCSLGPSGSGPYAPKKILQSTETLGILIFSQQKDGLWQAWLIFFCSAFR